MTSAGRKMFVFPKDVLLQNEVKTQILELPHPKYEKTECTFMLLNGSLHEIQKVGDDTSCFVGNSVVRNGEFHVVSKIDPLFVLLPNIRKNLTRAPSGNVCFTPGDQLCSDLYSQILASVPSKALANICETREYPDDDDMPDMFRLNEEKVQEWIKRKVKKIKNFFMSDCMDQSQYNDRFFTKQAIGILSEYISPSDFNFACRAFNCSKDDVNMVKKRKREVNPAEMNQESSKRLKEATQSAVKKVSRTDRALQKVDKRGLRSITSFFGGGKKKTKK